jgi:hypothetical protein
VRAIGHLERAGGGALTAAMFNYYAGVYYYQFTPFPNLIPYPEFSASNAVATQSGGPYPVTPTVISAALIGSWTA